MRTVQLPAHDVHVGDLFHEEMVTEVEDGHDGLVVIVAAKTWWLGRHEVVTVKVRD